MYSYLANKLLFPLHEFAKGHETIRVKKNLEKTQWLKREEIHKLQTNKFNKLLRHAYLTVPYYKDMLDRLGFNSNEEYQLNYISKLPYLTKEIIRENANLLTSKEKCNVVSTTTGGSTGETYEIFIEQKKSKSRCCCKTQSTGMVGHKIGRQRNCFLGIPY